MLQNLTPTSKGHLDQEHSNLKSTKTVEEEDFFPQSETTKTYEYASAIVSAEPE